MARFVRYAICIILPLSAVAGCSHAPPVSNTTVSPFNGLTDQSPAESARLQQAQNMLIAACMHGRFYHFHVPHPPTPHGPAGNTYGLISPSTASRQGYGILDNFVVNKEDDLIGIQAQPDAHRPGFESALTGTRASATTISLPGGGRIAYNANGCVTIAINELYTPTWNKTYYTVNTLALHIVSGVEASGTWKKAALIWSRCVKQHYGRTFADPAAAAGAVNSTATAQLANLSGDKLADRIAYLREGEVRLATTDALCQVQAGLAGAAARSQRIIEQPLEKKYAQDLKVYAQDMRHANGVTDRLLS
jgi:hypothetical protein